MLGGKQPIGRIPVQAPRPSLLTSARPLPDVNWSTGVSWSPDSCFPPVPFVVCAPGDNLRTTSESDGPVVADPFEFYTPFDCDWLTDDGEALVARAAELMEAHTAYAAARALWLGEGLPEGSTGGTLRTVAEDISSGADMALDDAVAKLLAQYEACTGGSGGATLHLPSTLAVAAVTGATRVAWPEGDVYRGPLGSVVVPGPGYPNGASDTGDDGFGPSSGGTGAAPFLGNSSFESWVYVTGPVEFALDPVVRETAAVPASRMNRSEVYAKRRGIVRFDPCCVFAQLVTNPTGVAS